MESNKLHILNPEHCIEILNSILEENYPLNKLKYTSYISMSYFIEYIDSFTSEQLESILSHKNFSVYASNRFVVDLMEVNKKSYLPEEIKTTLSNYEYNFKKIINKDKIEFLLQYGFDKEKTKEIVAILLDDVCFYLQALKEINPEYTIKLLSSPSIESIAKHPLTQQNLLQTLAANTVAPNLKPLIDLSMKNYQDILLTDVNMYIGQVNFNYSIKYCLYLFENKHYHIFNALAHYTSYLNDFDQEVVLNGVLEDIVDAYTIAKQKSKNINSTIDFSIEKNIQSLLQCDNSQTLKKIKQLIEKNQIDQSFLIQLEKNVLNNKLTKKLLEKNTQDKRMKI